MDTKTAEEVFEHFRAVVDLIRVRYKQPKIIIAELTPRTDNRDEQVKECNILIQQFVNDNEFLFLAKHGNLRTVDDRHYHDAKHITNFAVPIYVSNIKRALKTAYGIYRQNNRFGGGRLPADDQDNRHQDNRHRREQQNNRGRGNRGNRGRSRGRGRGTFGGRGGYNRGGGRPNNDGRGFNFQNEFEKFKLEIINIIGANRKNW